jgi:hypothetical protein
VGVIIHHQEVLVLAALDHLVDVFDGETGFQIVHIHAGGTVGILGVHIHMDTFDVAEALGRTFIEAERNLFTVVVVELEGVDGYEVFVSQMVEVMESAMLGECNSAVACIHVHLLQFLGGLFAVGKYSVAVHIDLVEFAAFG